MEIEIQFSTGPHWHQVRSKMDCQLPLLPSRHPTSLKPDESGGSAPHWALQMLEDRENWSVDCLWFALQLSCYCQIDKEGGSARHWASMISSVGRRWSWLQAPMPTALLSLIDVDGRCSAWHWIPLKLLWLRQSKWCLLLPDGEEEQLHFWPTNTLLAGKLHHYHRFPQGRGWKVNALLSKGNTTRWGNWSTAAYLGLAWKTGLKITLYSVLQKLCVGDRREEKILVFLLAFGCRRMSII